MLDIKQKIYVVQRWGRQWDSQFKKRYHLDHQV